MAAEKSVWQAFNELPILARAIIGILITGTVIFSAYKIFQAVKKAKDAKAEKESLGEVKDELQQLLGQGIRQTYPDSQYVAWGNSIADKLNGCIADEAGVIRIIAQLRNNVDWLKLVERFSLKTITGCMLADDRKVALQAAMQWKLSQIGIDSVNKVLKTKGIKYQI